MIPDSETLERALRRCARAGESLRLRRFALACAKAVTAGREPSLLWAEAIGLIEAHVDGRLVVDEFRRREALLECRFPLLVALGGLRHGDPRAAAALAVCAALNEDALEAALGASRHERLHARLLAEPQAALVTPGRRTSLPLAARDHARADDAVFYCLQRQAIRLRTAAGSAR